MRETKRCMHCNAVYEGTEISRYCGIKCSRNAYHRRRWNHPARIALKREFNIFGARIDGFSNDMLSDLLFALRTARNG